MPTAGWYPNPDGTGGARYWDGSYWTAHVTPGPAPAEGYGYGYAQPLLKAGSAATGPLPLHPMAVGDVLDGIFKLLKANFRTIAVIVSVVIIPFQILLAFLARNTLGGHGIFQVVRDPSIAANSGNTGLSSTVLRLAVELVNLFLLPFVGGAIATVVANSYLGREIGPAEALRATASRFWSLLGGWWIHLGIELVGLVCCVVGVLPAMALSLMIAPAIVTEHLGPVRGVKRSWRLASRRFWPTLGIMLLAGGIAYVLASILGGVPELAGFTIGLHWGWLLLALGASLSSLVVTPIAGITATLVYFDARIRTEGFDLQVIAAGLARPAGEPGAG